MAKQGRSVWDNVPARLAQASEGGVLDSLTGAIGKQAEQGVQRAVKEYLDTKGDAKISAVVDRINLVVTVTGIALTLYLVKQSGESK